VPAAQIRAAAAAAVAVAHSNQMWRRQRQQQRGGAAAAAAATSDAAVAATPADHVNFVAAAAAADVADAALAAAAAAAWRVAASHEAQQAMAQRLQRRPAVHRGHAVQVHGSRKYLWPAAALPAALLSDARSASCAAAPVQHALRQPCAAARRSAARLEELVSPAQATACL
jgi:hypothetical protein